MTKAELKKLACEAIDKRADDIIALGSSIFAEPELGYKEFKTADKMMKMFDSVGLPYQKEVAITGVIATAKGKESKLKVAVMGEMDAVVAPGHRCANKETGAAHSCGHHAMCAALAGVTYALADTEIMKHLSGDVALMAVPAEEYVEIEYRNELKEQGKISLLGGKQEFVKLGIMDDIDMMVMQHTMTARDGVLATCGGTSNGFVGRLIKYKGKEAHAAGAPHLGVNALSAANLGLQAVAMQRETFRDEDAIRVHPIITKGGDLVNVVPADVRLETYVRGNNVAAIEDAAIKVDRSFKAGGDAMGAETTIISLPGYMPLAPNEALMDLLYDNMTDPIMSKHFPEGSVMKNPPPMTGSTDAGDISHLMPTIHPNFGGATGVGHSENYEITEPDIAYIAAAKSLVMTVIDILADDAVIGTEIKTNSKPLMTKEQYLKDWGKL